MAKIDDKFIHSNKETKGRGPQNIMIMTMLMMRINKDGCLTRRIPPVHTNMIMTRRTTEQTVVMTDTTVLQVPMTVHQMKTRSKSILTLEALLYYQKDQGQK